MSRKEEIISELQRVELALTSRYPKVRERARQQKILLYMQLSEAHLDEVYEAEFNDALTTQLVERSK